MPDGRCTGRSAIVCAARFSSRAVIGRRYATRRVGVRRESAGARSRLNSRSAGPGTAAGLGLDGGDVAHRAAAEDPRRAERDLDAVKSGSVSSRVTESMTCPRATLDLHAQLELPGRRFERRLALAPRTASSAEAVAGRHASIGPASAGPCRGSAGRPSGARPRRARPRAAGGRIRRPITGAAAARAPTRT